MRAVAFLRGINVGTAKRVAMADLRRVVEGLGYEDVRTVLNSGNVVFTMPGSSVGTAARRIATGVATTLGVSSAVTVVSLEALAVQVRREPFAGTGRDASRLLVLMCRDTPSAKRLDVLARRDWGEEELSVDGTFGCAWCPQGIASSALWKAINAELGDGVTARNRATIDRILRGASVPSMIDRGPGGR